MTRANAISALLGLSAGLGVAAVVFARRGRQAEPQALQAPGLMPEVFSWWEKNGADMLEHFLTSDPAPDTVPKEWSDEPDD